ncbi:ATP-binding component of a transport system [Photobacterium aphoticum]|uniref:ATP-binding component of a transport system n=1 Tax=Photobacterium aphoticum TaxID=754436 RepID=A0A090QQZ0_9GAMM|nr:ATP-binding component of a transport system [Photobacterium aphoticum]
MSAIRAAAQAACIDSDIMQFPQGYDTLVGEKGITLSGGQKQRIAIARALLLEAEILVLDDALSAVDGKTEYQILQNLRGQDQRGQNAFRQNKESNRKPDRTVIVIAHRLTALEAADDILVLHQGRSVSRAPMHPAAR